MKELVAKYVQHISENQRKVKTILERENLESLVIHSGKLKYMFQDDMTYPFKANPLFKAWVPLLKNPNCWLIVNGSDKPKLVFFQPVDFWHSVPEDPTDYWVEHFDIIKMADVNEIKKILPQDKKRSVYLGEFVDDAKELGFEKTNDKAVLDFLHFHRAYKTEYEFDCLREANRIAVIGHQAAKEAFYAGASEFEIQLEYLKAVSHTQSEVPYGLIIGLNKNGAVLHYTDLDRNRFDKKDLHSFLIDGGATFNGYAADITRSYSYEKNEFADLISAMNKSQLELVQELKLGESYAYSHYKSLEKTAAILSDFKFINLSAEAILEKDLVKPFYPHGLGHHLGLQVHDLGANLCDDKGTPAEKPKDHPNLRASRVLEPRMVYTVEPGLYFIDSLLAEVKASENNTFMNWSKIEEFKKFGGIRIEDNVILHEDRIENITRDLGLE